MNASQFMDKQIMDLKTSSSSSFIDLMSNDDTDNNDKKKKQDTETILPSYDFHPIRSLSASLNLDSTAHSLPSYGSLGNVQSVTKPAVNDKDLNSDTSIVSEIDRTMKKHADNLLLVLECVSSRLSQLETRTRNLETSVDDLKVSVGNNYGSTDGKMRQLENILREVQTGVQALKDKQEIMEAQMQLSKLQMSKPIQQGSGSQIIANTEVIQQAASAPPQPHHQLPSSASFSTSLPAPLPTVPPPMPQQNLAPPAPAANQLHQTQITPVPQQEPYYQPPVPTQESSNPPYLAAPQQQPRPPPQLQQQPQPQPQTQPPPAVPQHQSYMPVSQPQFPPPSQQLQPQPPLGHHPEEAPYVQSQTYTPSLSQPSSHPPSSAPPPQQYYGAPSHMYEPPASRPSSGFSAGYFPPSGGHNEPYPYGRPSSQYVGSPPVKPQHSASAISQGGGSGYPQLPTARILPQALPTASGVSGGSSSPRSGNRVPIDDVVDKVTSMGFSREQVRATVRKLTENGQAVDLNIVLDKLMNDADVQPPRGWFGR